MAAMMEAAASEALAPGLSDAETTVGIELNIRHISATPVGMEVRAEAIVTAVEGKIISFELKAYDEAGLIGEGTHKRAVVGSEKFLERTYAKL